MKRIIYSIILIIIAELSLQQCANPLRPSGGPKDTIPPTLLLSNPLDQTIQFNGQEIRLYFDEFINAEKLRSKLIITPNTDIKYKHLVKRRDLILKFDQPLADSTTYTLNFFDGVTDITEKNPAENLIIAFSTGTYIDSLRVIGSVRDLFNNKPSSKTTVALYPLTDTLNILLDAPYYFVTTLENGSFEIKNIKTGKYKVAAFNDENKNLKLDVATEQYAFINDTIKPSVEPDSTYLRSVKIDGSQLKFISARPSGKYFDARYSKIINKYTVRTLDSAKIVYHNFNDERDAIRFYNFDNFTEKDSTSAIIHAIDTVGNYTMDTVYVKFRSSVRKSGEFKHQLTPAKSSPIQKNTVYSLEFNKPIIQADSNFVSYSFDTLMQFALKPLNLRWNDKRTKLSFSLDLDKLTYLDTLNKYINLYTPDTSNIDSSKLIYHYILTRIPTHKFDLNFSKKAFISVESDSSQAISQSYLFYEPEKYGIINLKLTTEQKSFFVQLINGQGKVSEQKYNCQDCKFTSIAPGDYSIRILIDDNNNGIWEVGNIGKSIEPEHVIDFNDKSALRANWTLELEYSF